MADRISPERRSWNMSRIKGRDTAPEMRVRRLLFRMGYRYRLHAPELPGRPDLVLRPRRKAVFVHGCFWHWHEGCPKFRLPATRTEFWENKLRTNRERDALNIARLEADGWKALTVWECEIADTDRLAESLILFLGPVRSR